MSVLYDAAAQHALRGSSWNEGRKACFPQEVQALPCPAEILLQMTTSSTISRGSGHSVVCFSDPPSQENPGSSSRERCSDPAGPVSGIQTVGPDFSFIPISLLTFFRCWVAQLTLIPLVKRWSNNEQPCL